MNVLVFPTVEAANEAAAGTLADWLVAPETRTLMVAAGNTPLELYRRIARLRLSLSQLTLFVLDEYVGVPLEEPRNCANVLRRATAEPWGIPADQFHTISSLPHDALESVRHHEQRIANAGGLDVVVLGLGQNGHLGFNEPGSTADSEARVVPLAHSSIEANRQWFAGDYAPAEGATVGLKTILAARKILLLAYGSHKANPVKAMIEKPPDAACPASFLQTRPEKAWVYLDAAAAAGLR